MSARSRQGLLPGLGLDEPPDRAAPVEDPNAVLVEAAPACPSMAPIEDRSDDAPRLAGKTVWVVDANNLIFQVYHAIPEMTSPKGEPVNAVFGFARDLLFLLEEKRPDYLFCAFDLPGKTFRHELFAEYKGTRAEMPDNLAPQFPLIRQVLAAMRLPILEQPGFEADDILATLARIVSEDGGECFLVSGDKDCRQLLSERVKVFNVRKNEYYDADSLLAEWGVRPEQVVDFQTLVGDSVDNIKGVPLIGPKIAGELLGRFGSLEGIFENLDKIPAGKRKENLVGGREQTAVTRVLVRLDTRTPVEIDWDPARVHGYLNPASQSVFEELGFRSMTEKARAAVDAVAAVTGWKADYKTVATTAALAELVAEMSRQPLVALDTETTSLSPRDAEIVGYSFAWKPGEAYYVPVRAPEGEPKLDPATTLETLRPFLESDRVGKVGQNIKYDVLVLRSAGVDVRGLAFDTMVASYLLDAGERNHNLDHLARRYLNHQNITIDQLIGTGKKQRRMDEVNVAEITAYAAEDADVAWRLMPILAPRLKHERLTELFETLEMPLIDVLAELEFNGIRIDVDRLTGLGTTFGERIAAIEQEIYELAGHEFNIASPKQLQEVLFGELKLPASKKTKTGPSTDVEVLEELADQHPLPAKIIEYRQYAKLKGTYIDALPALVSPRTGRVHCSFHQAVAATGRLSSSDPNLQNIPIRTEIGREIRSAFLPGHEDWLLVAADYSQIELRVLAHFSRDPALGESFARNEDIHARVASEVSGVPLDAVTREMRRRAKAVNFGVIYGQSPFGLAKQLKIDQDEAAAFIDAYFANYRGVEEFLTKTLAECHVKGYVETILGRRRAIRGVRPDAGRQRNLPERTAINTAIQGSAADLIKKAMIAIHGRLRADRFTSKLLLQIHDELVFESPRDEVERLSAMVNHEMSQVMNLSVPLVVDVKVGKNWAEVE